MKTSRLLILFSLIAFLLIPFLGCNPSERRIVPVETDTDVVYKAVSPNDEDSPLDLTFGSDSIPGITLDYEMATNDSDIYIYLNNFTLLDINPNINGDIFGFITEIMKENDFLSSSFKYSPEEFGTLTAQGLSFSASADSLLSALKAGFEQQVDSLQPILSAFNMNFLVYPVFLDRNYVTYRLTAGCYTGGAHGQTFSYLRTYELSTGKYMALKDIVKPEGLQDVRGEVVAHMAYSYPIYENITTVNQYLDSLNVWLDDFDPNDEPQKITMQDFPLSDPALTSQGLAFIYQMYELTPGSDGCPLVVIPYQDIRGCLSVKDIDGKRK